ncbi:MAG: EamA family transporter [Henriciella sp.]|jgi:O-acetylserine/cysteine efflux transporter|uniref:DMT family transporter n=1 Tax=Henriciella sp. TaxID=1968823 RepID=UPI000C0C5826|nr:DMT family transporter [Henriciella sp.]MBF34615.1 EamA family transporter [Hyphomonadaceae bacterium]MBK76214.1 EamA family transporter [Henriciella sp.]PHR71549.1 MAG: EamA family transporter [Henriciella sp.]|tara:strand:- start:2845 stop:3744 length:900 start_codon:yes stop_codon:yes gene_type:complete
MGFRDFMLLFAVCFVWGLNLVVTRWVVADAGVPPIFFAGVRFAGIALVLIPFLLPAPRHMGILFAIAMCMGAVHFALLFMGLANAEASAVSVTGQLGVPFATLMSMAFLGETVGWRRGLGIMLAFAGVTLIAFDPGSFSVSFGLIYVIVSAFVGASGGILMKKMAPISALQLQAWLGLFSFAPLLAFSALTESGQVSAFMEGGWLVWVATAFAVLGVSVFGHGAYYSLIKKYDISLLSPLTLMTPIWGVVLAVSLLGEPLTLRLVVGAAISLSGVFVIAIRRNRALPEAALPEKARIAR